MSRVPPLRFIVPTKPRNSKKFERKERGKTLIPFAELFAELFVKPLGTVKNEKLSVLSRRRTLAGI